MISSVAAESGVAPGLVHHHFESKAELLSSLLTDLVARFRTRIQHYEKEDPLLAYIDSAPTARTAPKGSSYGGSFAEATD